MSLPPPFNELVFGGFYFSHFISLLDALHGLGYLMVSNKVVPLASLHSALIFFKLFHSMHLDISDIEAKSLFFLLFPRWCCWSNCSELFIKDKIMMPPWFRKSCKVKYQPSGSNWVKSLLNENNRDLLNWRFTTLRLYYHRLGISGFCYMLLLTPEVWILFLLLCVLLPKAPLLDKLAFSLHNLSHYSIFILGNSLLHLFGTSEVAKFNINSVMHFQL